MSTNPRGHPRRRFLGKGPLAPPGSGKMKEAETLSLSREAWGCLQREGKQLVRLESYSSPHSSYFLREVSFLQDCGLWHNSN